MSKLKDRVESYIESTNYKLLNKVPVIICINGRSFSKTTSLLDKPFCEKFSECMISTTLRLCSEIEGSIFGYQFNDEIVIVTRNDQNLETTPWFDNKIQKISSAASSIATSHFNECYNKLNISMLNDPIFTAQVFAVPNYSEVINTIIYKQQANFHISVQNSCFYELLKKYDKNNIKEMLSGLSIDDKINLLYEECNITFNNYPTDFRRGTAVYKVPKLVDGVLKNKWVSNSELPIFTKDQSMIGNIIKNGMELFR